MSVLGHRVDVRNIVEETEHGDDDVCAQVVEAEEDADDERDVAMALRTDRDTKRTADDDGDEVEVGDGMPVDDGDYYDDKMKTTRLTLMTTGRCLFLIERLRLCSQWCHLQPVTVSEPGVTIFCQWGRTLLYAGQLLMLMSTLLFVVVVVQLDVVVVGVKLLWGMRMDGGRTSEKRTGRHSSTVVVVGALDNGVGEHTHFHANGNLVLVLYMVAVVVNETGQSLRHHHDG